MKNYVMKSLIVLGIFGLFLFVNSSKAFAGTTFPNNADCSVTWTTPIGCNSTSYTPNYPYSPNNNNQYGSGSYYSGYYYNNPAPVSNAPIANNYYKTVPITATISKTKTSSAKTSSISSTKSTPKTTTVSTTPKTIPATTTIDTTGFTDYSNGNNLAALSFHGARDSFLPGTFWQWLLVIVLILIIVILMRLINKSVKDKKINKNPVH